MNFVLVGGTDYKTSWLPEVGHPSLPGSFNHSLTIMHKNFWNVIGIPFKNDHNCLLLIKFTITIIIVLSGY